MILSELDKSSAVFDNYKISNNVVKNCNDVFCQAMTPQFGKWVDLGEAYPCAKFGCPSLRRALLSFIQSPKEPNRVRVNDQTIHCTLREDQLREDQPLRTV